jgi:hypothetical protein
MANEIVFMDSFDHYTDAFLDQGAGNSLPMKADHIANVTADADIDTTGGRGGGGAYYNEPNNRTYYCLPADEATVSWLVGFAFKNTLSDDYSPRGLLGFYWVGPSSDTDDDWRGGTIQWALNLSRSGALYCTRRYSTSMGDTDLFSPECYPADGTWHNCVVKTTIDNTTGTIEVWVDGIKVIDVSGLDNNYDPYGEPGAAGIYIVGGDSGGNDSEIYIDDLYAVTDPSGDWGDRQIEALLPNGNGSNSGWSRSGGSNNYEMVDETNPDADTTYVYASSTVKDTYAFQNLSASNINTIDAVQVTLLAMKHRDGARTINTVARESGGTEADSGAFEMQHGAGGDAFVPIRHVYETKPSGGAWSESDVNGAEFGMEVAS